jgi:hypothetical protein
LGKASIDKTSFSLVRVVSASFDELASTILLPMFCVDSLAIMSKLSVGIVSGNASPSGISMVQMSWSQRRKTLSSPSLAS